MLALVTTLVTLVTTLAHASAPPVYASAAWTRADGLPSDSVNDLLFTRDGYLWLATFDGLARFDGVRFVVFDTDTTPGMPGNRVTNLLEARDGAVWFGTESGHVARRDPVTGAIRAWALGVAAGPPSLVEGPSGTVWTATADGVARFDGGDWVRQPLGEPGAVGALALAEDAHGALWIASNARGLARLDGSGLRWWTTADGLASDGAHAVAVAPDGAVWVGTARGLARIEGDRVVPVEVDGAAWDEHVVSLHPGDAGEVWVGTEEGTARWSDGRLVPLDPGVARRGPAGPPVLRGPDGHTWALSRRSVFLDGAEVARVDDGVRGYVELAVDAAGGAWVATANDGLLHLEPATVRTYGAAMGIENAYALAEGAGGAVWVGSQRGGLARVGPDGVTPFDADAEVPRNVTAVYEAPDGALWVGARDRGLLRHEGSGPFAPVSGGPAGETVRVIERLRDGGLLVAGGTTLWRLDGDTWTRLDPRLGVAAAVRAVLEDDDGTLWLATNGDGLLRVRGLFEGPFRGDVRVERLGRAEGYPSDVVRSVWRSPDGLLFVGTEDEGLWMAAAPAATEAAPAPATVRTLSRAEGLVDHAVHALVPDALGNLWGSTNRGLFRVALAELAAFARGDRPGIHADVYTERDGMVDPEANGGVHRSGIRTRDGRIWFATQAGLAVVDPAAVVEPTGSPTVRIEGVERDGREVAVTERVTVPPEGRSFGLTYTVLAGPDLERQRFWYRLDGVDPAWVDAGVRRTAWYTQVPPGTHVFHVRASPPGEAGPEATLTLDVTPRFVETAWFRGALLLTGAGLVAGLVGARLAAGRRREAELSRLVGERTAALAAEKEAAEAARAIVAAQAARLEEVDRLKTRFFTNLSHELRTPLTLVMGPLEDVRTGRHGAIPEEAAAHVALAERSARRLFGLVNQLLDLVRLDVGALRLERAPQDLGALVAAVGASFRPVAERRGLRFEVTGVDAPLIVDFDRRELEKVLMNLLSNAVKFTPAGGRVSLALDRAGADARVTVSDTGPGIPEAARAHVFDRFYTVPGVESTLQPGSGIGLSLAHELTARHGGRLELADTAGEGATFIVVLPLSTEAPTVEAAPPTGPAPELPERAAAPEPVDPDDRTTVLLVEDQPDLRAWLRGRLATRYHVVEAADGHEALLAARRALPDLVLSDVMMPGMDGFALVRALHADPALAHVPVVLLTARGSDESRVEGLDRGADAYLTKPISSQVLLAQVDALLVQRRRLRVRFAAGPAAVEPEEDTLSADDRYLRRVRAAVEEHLHEPTFGVQELADAVAQDRAHLFRRVKQLTGEPPSTLVRVARLERAARLLARRTGSVGEIAYGVGFNGVSHFSKCFRDHFGVTPTEFVADR